MRSFVVVYLACPETKSTTLEGVARVLEGGKAIVSKANHIAEMFAKKGDAVTKHMEKVD